MAAEGSGWPKQSWEGAEDGSGAQETLIRKSNNSGTSSMPSLSRENGMRAPPLLGWQRGSLRRNQGWHCRDCYGQEGKELSGTPNTLTWAFKGYQHPGLTWGHIT